MIQSLKKKEKKKGAIYSYAKTSFLVMSADWTVTFALKASSDSTIMAPGGSAFPSGAVFGKNDIWQFPLAIYSISDGAGSTRHIANSARNQLDA